MQIARSQATSLRFRVMTEPDIAEGLRLCRASNWNQVADDWRCFLSLEGGRAWLAEADGVTAGSVAVLRYGNSFSWLSMMLVDPQQRRSGVGAKLMETALSALAGDACVRLDATPAGEPLYRRYGFVPEYGLTRNQILVASDRLPFTPGNARRMEVTDLERVFARDLEAFGSDRSALLRDFYRRAPELAWVLDDGDCVKAYCFGRGGHLYSHLGPVVAEGPESARALLGHCLAQHDGRKFALDSPMEQPTWLSWLRTIGFVEERPFLRMRLGGSPPPGLPDRQYGIGGPEFG